MRGGREAVGTMDIARRKKPHGGWRRGPCRRHGAVCNILHCRSAATSLGACIQHSKYQRPMRRIGRLWQAHQAHRHALSRHPSYSEDGSPIQISMLTAAQSRQAKSRKQPTEHHQTVLAQSWNFADSITGSRYYSSHCYRCRGGCAHCRCRLVAQLVGNGVGARGHCSRGGYRAGCRI